MSKRPLENAEQVEVAALDDLRHWLAQNYTRTKGVWLVTYKKAVPEKYVTISDVIVELLCFGWVDSLSRGKDDRRTMVYISPRKRGSNWSRVNKEKIADLRLDNRIMPSGEAVIARAQSDGSWAALDDVENLVIPPDLAGSLTPQAFKNWEAFPRSVKRGALEILLNAKRKTTRAAKIQIIAECAARNERPFQYCKS